MLRPYFLILIFYISLGLTNVHAQNEISVLDVEHYIFYYAYTNSKDNPDKPVEVAVTPIFRDTADVHYYFKVLNIKNRATEVMREELTNFEDFVNYGSDLSKDSDEADKKLKDLMQDWKSNDYIIHRIRFQYDAATGQEYPD